MDCTQKLLATSLSAAIRGQLPEKSIAIGIDWTAFYKEAQKHDVFTLLYPIVKELYDGELSETSLLNQWHKATLLAGIEQTQHIEQTQNILSRFRQENIPVIALKGLFLRELYPNPELRTMVDADILVRTDDVKASRKLLTNMGYTMEYSDSGCLHFEHKAHLSLELHHTLFNLTPSPATQVMEDAIWENPIPFNICSESALSLSLEDQALYLCLHMAKHLISYGFGLRQLCDFVLFVEYSKNAIDWIRVSENSKILGIHSFAQAVFIICNRLFALEIPLIMLNMPLEKDPHLELLINDIFSGGLHGHSSVIRHISNRMLHNSDILDCNKSSKKYTYFFSYIFPSPKKLGEKYFYAKKIPMLYPVAWVHRLAFNLFRNNLLLILKTSLTSSSQSITILESRSELLQWLGLK